MKTVKIFGWKPPQRPWWVKELMQYPRPVRVQLVLLLILTLSSCTSTVIQIGSSLTPSSDHAIMCEQK